MITIPVSFSISSGTAPYTFTFTSSNPNVTFSNVTGTAPFSAGVYSASTDVIYGNQSFISTAIIRIIVTDANGCSKTSDIVVNNPCNLQSTVTNNGEFVFTATTTGGSGSYTYEWGFDETIFELSDTVLNDNNLSLKLKKLTTQPVSTTINTIITDSNGCALRKFFNYNFCYPTASPFSVGLSCNAISPNPALCNIVQTTSSYSNYDMRSHVTTCSNQVIDWTKTTFTAPAGYCVVNNNGIITIYSDKFNTSVNIPYRVETTSGLIATNVITVIVPACQSLPDFSSAPLVQQLIITDVVSSTKKLPVEPRVAGEADWSTFAITKPPTWGTAVFNANREIVYTVTDVTTTPTVPETIGWSLNNYSGKQINITDVILRNRIALPTLIADIVCTTCGGVVGPLDVLANDTGSIDRSTLTIVANDPDVNIVKDTSNNLLFTTSVNAGFNNINTYKVANTQGAYASPQTITVKSACVGANKTPTLDLTCLPSKVFNIKDSFPGAASFANVYTETTPSLPTYASQGGTIVGANGTVTLTGLVNKTYTFSYTAQNEGACSPAFDDTGVLTVIHNASPSLTIGLVLNNEDGTITIPFTYSGLTGTVDVRLNGLVPAFRIPPTLSGGTGTCTIFGVSGLNTIVVSGATTCSSIITDTDATITL